MTNNSYGIGSDSNQRFRGDVDDQNLESAINADPEAFGTMDGISRFQSTKDSSKNLKTRSTKSNVNKMYEKDDTGEKTLPEGENDEGFEVHENV